MTVIDYKPPPTIERFIKFHKRNELFQAWITGPVGSGKTTADFMKLVYLSSLENPDDDGVRRTKAVIVRNTMPQLRDTTIASWRYWFQDGVAGDWKETDKTFYLRFPGVECDVLFRALDTPDDISRVLSLEVNFAIIDEFVQIPYQIIEALSGRLGRYKRPDGTRPSIYGMWGASNPDNEDNWWHDYLHRCCEDPARNMPPDEVARYFKQPSGMAADAENLDNLPNNYYTNLCRGKSPTWIKQFVEGEWGFSISGQPVVASFRKDVHVSRTALSFNPAIPIIVGLDPGLGGTAAIFMQRDTMGYVNVLGELTTTGVGAKRFVDEHLKPFIQSKFPKAKVLIAIDPAASNRSPNDENTMYRTFRREFDCWTETNNRLPLRLDAIDHFMNTMIAGAPIMRIDPCCTTLIRALGGGWRWEMDQKKDVVKGAQPEKNRYSHPGDAFGYGCRYFHKATERDIRYKAAGVPKFTPPKTFGSNYHIR